MRIQFFVDINICIQAKGLAVLTAGPIFLSEKEDTMKKKRRVLIFMMFCILAFTGCGATLKAKEVKSVDDVEGSKIGVQLGTTGDIYASDYENDDAGSVVER